MKTVCICGRDLEEMIRDGIDDSRDDQKDGYTDCKTILTTCPHCNSEYDVEYNDDREVIAFELEEKGEWFIYQEGTETLRLMPYNYMVASFAKKCWIVDVDGAIPEKLAVSVFKYFLVHGNKFNLESWKGLVIRRD